jgi:hypothetical protein
MPVSLKLAVPEDTALKKLPQQVLSCKKEKKNSVAAFFHRINPLNWFDEFSNIIISLQEFGSRKNK